MKIAYLVNQYPQPSHSFIRREIAALESLGVTVDRFTLRASDGTLVDPRDKAEKSKARIVLGVGPIGLASAVITTALTRPRAFSAGLRLALRIGRRSERGMINNLVYLAEACVLRKWLADAQIPHVHAHFGTNSTAVAMLCRVLGGPTYSFTAHGPEEFDKPMAIRLDEKIKHAAFVVGISNFGRSQLCRWCEFKEWDKIKVVRCGVDELFLNQDASTLPPPPTEARFVCVGRLVPQKGQMLLLEAVAKLASEGVKIELLFAGDGALRPALEKRIAELNLGGQVRLGGWMSNEQVREAMLNSRAMVLPSFAEGLPVVIMEALALHRPVVTTRIAGTPELVRDGESGWVVTPGTVDELADALRKAASATQDELARMGNEGAKRVREAHNSRTEAQRLMRLFEQVVTIFSLTVTLTERRYCLITPCRDEAKYARRTIETVLRQSVLPTLWVIVDDGSTDDTPKILAEYAAQHPWIKIIRRDDRGQRVLGAGVIEAFNDGYKTIDPHDFDYICKFDLDLDLPPGYFEEIMQRMEADPRIGTCSGKPYFHRPAPEPATAYPITESVGFVSEKCGDENSVGMIKFYRTDCFEQIGGFVKMLMWDGIDCHRCRLLGWVAQSWDDPSLRFEHLRPMGTSHKNWWTGRVRHGVGQYYMGTGPIYMLVSAVYRIFHPPKLVGSVAMLWGYFKSFATRRPRYDDPEFRRFLRGYQWACIFKGKARATAALNRQQADRWTPPPSTPPSITSARATA